MISIRLHYTRKMTSIQSVSNRPPTTWQTSITRTGRGTKTLRSLPSLVSTVLHPWSYMLLLLLLFCVFFYLANVVVYFLWHQEMLFQFKPLFLVRDFSPVFFHFSKFKYNLLRWHWKALFQIRPLFFLQRAAPHCEATREVRFTLNSNLVWETFLRFCIILLFCQAIWFNQYFSGFVSLKVFFLSLIWFGLSNRHLVNRIRNFQLKHFLLGLNLFSLFTFPLHCL